MRFESASQRRVIEHNEVIQALPPNESDQALDIGTLPWRSWGRQDFANRYPSGCLPRHVAIDAIAIMKQIAWGPVPRECSGHLLGRPFRCGRDGDVEVSDLPCSCLHDREEVQHPKIGRHRGEEVAGQNTLCG